MDAVVDFFHFACFSLFVGICIAIIIACPALALVYIFLFAKIW